MKLRSWWLASFCCLLPLVLSGCASPKIAPPPAPAAKPVPAPAAEPSPRIRELLLEYRDTLLAAERNAEALYRNGTLDFEALGKLRLARLGAELDLAETRDARIAILTALLDGARGQEELQQGRYEAELATDLELLQARALRIKAEIALELEKNR